MKPIQIYFLEIVIVQKKKRFDYNTVLFISDLGECKIK